MSDALRSHPNCWGPAGHICQEPSGRACIEKGCDQPAGTHWGPYWCPEHDVERLDRISANLDSMLATLETMERQPLGPLTRWESELLDAHLAAPTPREENG
jgi:hypothetical protein